MVDNVNARWGRFNDLVTVTYHTVDGDIGETSMTGRELTWKINRWVWGRKRDDWWVHLYDLIGETGVTNVTVTLQNAMAGRWARSSKVDVKAMKFCGNEVTDVIKPRNLGEDDLD